MYVLRYRTRFPSSCNEMNFNKREVEYFQKLTFLCYATRHQGTMEILDFFYMSWELGELSQRVLTKLQAGQLQNHGLIPRRGKILLSKMSRPVLGRPSLLCSLSWVRWPRV